MVCDEVRSTLEQVYDNESRMLTETRKLNTMLSFFGFFPP